jgi:putative hydrolase of the HAD superfamily
MARLDVVAFDGDDTLWHNERIFVEAQGEFRALLAAFHPAEWIDARLAEAERRNLPHFGYGIKGFALSMIETAIELTEGRIESSDIRHILDIARKMLAADVQLLDRVRETVADVAGTHRIMLITKGDLHDQEQKVARSGLGSHFKAVEIVSEKNPGTYSALLKRHGVAPDRFLMVGNSLRSDVLPVLEVGGNAVHIPYELTWSHEAADPPPAGHPRFHSLEHIGQLPALLKQIETI